MAFLAIFEAVLAAALAILLPASCTILAVVVVTAGAIVGATMSGTWKKYN